MAAIICNVVEYIKCQGGNKMKKVLAWFTNLFFKWFCNSKYKTKLTQKERDKIIKLTQKVDMDEY